MAHSLLKENLKNLNNARQSRRSRRFHLETKAGRAAKMQKKGIIGSSEKSSAQFKGDFAMTQKIRSIILGVSILALAGMINLAAVDIAGACGWGQSGGGDYVPQRRDSGEIIAKRSAVSEDQARDLVTNYVKKLNPNLQIGSVKDNGGFYEVEILDEGREIVQLLGVDKRSGRLILLN